MKASLVLTSILGAFTLVEASSQDPMTADMKHQSHRILSGSEDSYDDDFWAYDNGSYNTAWSDFNLSARKCVTMNKKHYIVFELFGRNNKGCSRKKKGTYTMDVGKFAKAYVAQKKIDYKYMGKDYGDADSLDYVDCTLVEYNGNNYYAKLGCSSQGGLKILAYSDAYCATEVNANIGLYNDIKLSFNYCNDCVTWPVNNDDDAANAEGDDAAQDDAEGDDNFEYYHQFDSKLCSAADYYKSSCGWGCKRMANKGTSSSSYSSSRKYWNGLEKFFLLFWSVAAVGLIWVVLKQRRMMSREDAIVEEAAMNGVGLRKRHIFPIALGIIFFIIFSMFMVWKRLTWLLLIGSNIGLFAHFAFLRRKAKQRSGLTGYVKDGGLQIS
eukprot:CAMPEP_0171340966 /NCGR_PEP_ID=MMETSP0878-20121228/8889_1 /TAXON_ID=67004 /ORGANISM="Thalassiosira weissflogii, Strain CCMP1336" /LENGTH=381 /DNA_ID=CAMNT_0011843093 /DNA_START=182 /DNA_END=1327 /DNA_ORIENTATION=-